MTRPVLLHVVAAFILALFAINQSAYGQQNPNVERGFAPSKVFQFGDLDHINMFNGNLVIAIPLGHPYETSGGFTYGITLRYTGNVWDYKRHVVGQTFWTEARPNRHSN